MKRVEEGKQYWYIGVQSLGCYIEHTTDIRSIWDDERAACHNYFRTREEAESAERKFRAVLNGAEVIEKWEIKEMLNTLYAALNTEYGITALDSEKERKEKLSNETCLARMLKSSIELLESKVVK